MVVEMHGRPSPAPNIAMTSWLIAAFGERHLTGLGAAVKALTYCCFLSAYVLTIYIYVLYKSLKR